MGYVYGSGVMRTVAHVEVSVNVHGAKVGFLSEATRITCCIAHMI